LTLQVGPGVVVTTDLGREMVDLLEFRSCVLPDKANERLSGGGRLAKHVRKA
jgi:hypothetical protein